MNRIEIDLNWMDASCVGKIIKKKGYLFMSCSRYWIVKPLDNQSPLKIVDGDEIHRLFTNPFSNAHQFEFANCPEEGIPFYTSKIGQDEPNSLKKKSIWKRIFG